MMRNPNLIFSFTICLFWLMGFKVFAQSNQVLTGTVKDEKGEAVPGATVFLTNTQHKTATNNDGKFIINKVEAGTYQLVVKMIGFAPNVSEVLVNSKSPSLIITLKEDNKLLNAVTIKSTDPNRKKYMADFVKYFIGQSANASQCKILNPQALVFHYDRNTDLLQATADTILRVENNGLGYILNYVLTEFRLDPKNDVVAYTGYPYFENLKGTPSQERLWENNRKESYLGSARHFFRSVYNSTAAADGFVIYSKGDLVSANTLFTPSDNDLKRFNPQKTDTLTIFYRYRVQPFAFEHSGLKLSTDVSLSTDGQLSSLKPMAENVFIDKNGVVTPTKGFYVRGYWGWEKLAELLPLGYHVDVTSVLPVEPHKQQAVDVTEKAHLHLDRNFYAAGDTIWFKGYVVSGAKHRLSMVSNVLNVELVNDRDSVKQRLKLELTNGLAHGGLPLPDLIREGNYRVRAYTNWMRNDDEEYFFDQNVRIINAIIDKPMVKTAQNINTKNAAPSQTVRKAGVQFFPEGGSFVDGLNCRIAFKAFTASGLGLAATGIVTDEQGNQVAEFSCGKLGMGSFYLEPAVNKNYKADIKLADNTILTVPLPKATTNGYVLSVTPSGTDHIRVAAQAVGIPAGEMTLIGRLGGVIYYEGKSKPGNSFTANIPKDKFPTGVVQFTLYSSYGEPLNERLIFIQNNDQLRLAVTAEKKTYTLSQKVKINLTAKTSFDGPAQGSFSVVVVDESKLPVGGTRQSGILSNLLLTSDLKGFIENPEYYFNSTDQQTADDLDALLLTQGYRKFSWQEGVKYPADTGLTISGYLTTRANKPAPNAAITMYSMGKAGFFAWDTVTNNAGRFTFRKLSFADSMSFVVQSAEKVRYQYKIGVDMDNPIAAPNKNWPELSVDNDMDLLPFIRNNKQLYIKELQYDYNGKARLLREVEIKARPQQNLASPHDALRLERADYVVTGKQLTALKIGNTSDALIGLIPGLTFNGNHQLQMGAGLHKPPLLVSVDGVLIPDLDMIRPNNIESVEFRFNSQQAGLSGVLIINLKRGTGDDDVTYGDEYTGYRKFSPRGFYKVREFYSPQNDNPETNKEIADLRTTIYWNPTLVTDKDGNTSFEYFNATKGTYRVTVEGIDGEGRLGSAVYSYKVE